VQDFGKTASIALRSIMVLGYAYTARALLAYQPLDCLKRGYYPGWITNRFKLALVKEFWRVASDLVRGSGRVVCLATPSPVLASLAN